MSIDKKTVEELPQITRSPKNLDNVNKARQSIVETYRKADIHTIITECPKNLQVDSLQNRLPEFISYVNSGAAGCDHKRRVGSLLPNIKGDARWLVPTDVLSAVALLADDRMYRPIDVLDQALSGNNKDDSFRGVGISRLLAQIETLSQSELERVSSLLGSIAKNDNNTWTGWRECTNGSLDGVGCALIEATRDGSPVSWHNTISFIARYIDAVPKAARLLFFAEPNVNATFIEESVEALAWGWAHIHGLDTLADEYIETNETLPPVMRLQKLLEVTRETPDISPNDRGTYIWVADASPEDAVTYFADRARYKKTYQTKRATGVDSEDVWRRAVSYKMLPISLWQMYHLNEALGDPEYAGTLQYAMTHGRGSLVDKGLPFIDDNLPERLLNYALLGISKGS